MPYDKSVVVPLPPEETFALLTEPARLRRWNSIAARIDVRAGGDYRFIVTPGMRATGTIRESEPGRRIVLGWGWEGSAIVPPDASTVTITLEPTHDGTIVRLVHEGLDAEQGERHGEGWDHYLGRLVAAGGGDTGDAGPDDYHGQLAELDELKAAEAALAVVEGVLRRIGPADHARPVPSCPEFTVADLADHLANSVVQLGGAAGAELVAGHSGSLETDLADLSAPALEAWAARGLAGTIAMGPMELPATYLLGILVVEYVVHAWDFALATGQSVLVPDELASYALEMSKRVVSDEMRVPGMFSAERDCATDTDAMDRLIAFTGRPAAEAM